MKTSIITHSIVVTIFSLIMLLIYTTVRQNYRSVANEPQTQLKRGISHTIKYNRTYRYYINGAVDPKHSLGTFMQLYNEHGQLVFSGGTVPSKAPQIPYGFGNNAKQYFENAFTWRPAPHVRLVTTAANTTKPNTVYVVVTRTLQETENCETRLTQMILFPRLLE